MKKLFISLFLVFVVMNVHAQVTIGSQSAPHRGAVLDLKSDSMGFLPPRIVLSKLYLPDPLPLHVEGMVVFNTTVSPADTLQTGLYYNSGTQWVRLSTVPYFMDNWFYMPSVVFDISTTGTGFTKDLYQEYVKQFVSPITPSDGAPAKLPVALNAGDLYYYVSDCDTTVFSNIKINAHGVMTYDITKPATDATFMNIVFVAK